jgi:hypothetical protein
VCLACGLCATLWTVCHTLFVDCVPHCIFVGFCLVSFVWFCLVCMPGNCKMFAVPDSFIHNNGGY